MLKFLKKHAKWSVRTFGYRNFSVPLEHLLKEIDEIKLASNDIEEWADCFLLLMDAARCAGHNHVDVIKAAKLKFIKNTGRSWHKVDNHFEHNRDE